VLRRLIICRAAISECLSKKKSGAIIKRWLYNIVSTNNGSWTLQGVWWRKKNGIRLSSPLGLWCYNVGEDNTVLMMAVTAFRSRGDSPRGDKNVSDCDRRATNMTCPQKTRWVTYFILIWYHYIGGGLNRSKSNNRSKLQKHRCNVWNEKMF